MSGKWPMVKLGEVIEQSQDACRVQGDSAYPNFGIYSFGRGLFRKQPISGAASSATTLYRARAGQFVYSRLFAFEGAYGVVSAEFDGSFVSNEFPLFSCDLRQVAPEYLGWLFRLPSIWGEVAKLTTGMGDRRRRVKPEHLVTYKIPLPPLPEQQRIVAKIDQLAAKIAEARGLRAIASIETAALPKAASRSMIGDCPKGDWAELRSCVLDIENGWSPACLSQRAGDGEWGVLKVGAVSFGRFESRENKALPPTLAPMPQYEIQPGDFLMSRANTRELVGACAYVHETRPRLILCDKIFRFHFRPASPIEPRYLEHVLKSPALRTQIEQGATGTSPTMKNISKAKILSLRIPLRSLAEQRRIVSYLDELQANVDRMKELQAATADELDALLPSILDRAFKGEL